MDVPVLNCSGVKPFCQKPVKSASNLTKNPFRPIRLAPFVRYTQRGRPNAYERGVLCGATGLRKCTAVCVAWPAFRQL